MNTRRTNKSHRVPNVKLRPAQPSTSTTTRKGHPPSGSYPSSLVSNPLALASSPGEPDVTFVDHCPRPFHGVVLCATGIPDKTTLFKRALELGAGHHNHFTKDVTHLIADEHGGAKYACAVKGKIPIVRSSWIMDCYEVWLRGDDVNFEESLAKHRLPIFSNVVLVSSGIQNSERRLQISKIAAEQKGVYVKNIERPVKVTHLLCSGDEDTEKMKYARKFNERGEADIKLVWEEWFWDCLIFGGRLDESDYLITGPRPEIKNLEPDLPPSSLQQDHHPPHSTTSPTEPSLQAHRELSAIPEAEEETASARRVPHVTLQLWENILGPRGFEIVEGKLKRSPTKAKALGVGSVAGLDEFPVQPSQNLTEKGSMLSTFRRANSFAPANKDGLAQQPQRRQPFSKNDSLLPLPLAPSRQHSASRSGSHTTAEGERTFFAGKRFRAFGEARCLNVKTVVEGAGGSWMLENDEDVDFVIVRLVSGSKFFHDEGDETERKKFRTECWLERCNYVERICDPEDHVTFRPLGIQIPLRGAEEIHLSFSGLDESETCWTRRFLRAIGANLANNFSRRSTHLLCPSFTGAKYDKAIEWGVPVIDTSWLEDVAKNGAFPVLTRFSVENVVPRPQDKGKRRQVNPDSSIVDMRNGGLLPEQDQRFIPNDNLLATEGDDSFGHSSMFIGHSTPKRIVPIKTTSQGKSGVHGSSPTQSTLAVKLERIPSSSTPSPMKIRESPPKKPLLDQQATKKLQDSITNLLGKRRSSAEEIATQGRVAKRTRPMTRTKSSSKKGSVENDSFVYEARGGVNGAVFGSSRTPHDDEGEEPGGQGRQRDSLRVVYEDPKQREEKERLLSLLGGVPADQGGPLPVVKKGGLVRRSTRIAGI